MSWTLERISILAPSAGPGPAAAALWWVRVALFGAALVIFAFGIRRSGSVVARRRLGVVALLVLAVWPLVERFVTVIVPPSMDTLDFSLPWGYVSLAVQVAAAIVAVISIARAGVIPSPWRWAPLWALLAILAPQLITYLMLAAPGSSAQDWFGVLVGLTQLVAIAAPLFLGILAILLARRPFTESALQVYPPPA